MGNEIRERLLEDRATSVSIELDPFNYGEFCHRAMSFESEHRATPRARYYPGYHELTLPKPSRPWKSLCRALEMRQCERSLSSLPYTSRELSTILYWSHGAMRPRSAGPVPSSGSLQSLELYVVSLQTSWLSPGAYHYARERHALSRLSDRGRRDYWRGLVPSLDHVSGGSIMWILVSDMSLIREKYGERARKLVCLEAGHLMQNLCLVSAAIGASTVPAGGFFESGISDELGLTRDDTISYVGMSGKIG